MYRLFAVLSVLLVLSGIPAAAQPQWMTLPPTPTLPATAQSGLAPVNGIKIWYAVFGQGEPVMLLHGGLANSNYWGHQVRALQDKYQVIVMDSRGHGRSSRDATPYGYDLMASDVIGLDLAMKHPGRVSKVFAFAANSDPSGVADIARSKVFQAFIARAETEYRELSPTPNGYKAFLGQIEKMWASQPHWTAKDLGRIHLPTWIVDGDHDEAIKRQNTEFMAAKIPGAGLLLQPEVSHFSFIQDPEQFNMDVLHFLQHVKGR
jgi:pimeloyl-ACP methyl ester carboxylesterase